MQRGIAPKTAIAMVGLPARGKSHIARKLARYLTWTGYRTQIFNVGNYRREIVGSQKRHEFYDHANAEFSRVRREVAMAALRDMLSWLRKGGDVGIYDATNTTRQRRELIVEQCEAEGVRVVFVESICDDVETVLDNMRATKLGSPDYTEMELDDAVDDFRERIRHYEAVYVPVDDESASYVKLIDGGRKFIANRMEGYLPSRVLFFLMNLRITTPTLWLTRHGQSLYNVEGRIGGDSDLSPLGKEYAKNLATFMTDHRDHDQHLTVWTSSLRRALQTAAFLAEVPTPSRALNEIDAGVCDGMTYETIRAERPKDYDARKADKLRYRYPRGESYQDVIARLDSVILEIERHGAPIVIISHNAVVRAIYGYFMGLPPKQTPHLSIPLHTVIKLSPNPYGCAEERFPLEPSVESTESG